MTTILVWLLITVSDGYYNRGTSAVLERFADVAECERVRRNIPRDSNAEVKSVCVQARIVVVEKGLK
jgi:hypothetical protein